MKLNDDEIAENVLNAIRNDAYTTDLDIDVTVENGIVYLRGRVNSLDDVEQAEEVAGSVEGVVDVEEELEII
jgi:osmotically-inducible protein OsmY